MRSAAADIDAWSIGSSAMNIRTCSSGPCASCRARRGSPTGWSTKWMCPGWRWAWDHRHAYTCAGGSPISDEASVIALATLASAGPRAAASSASRSARWITCRRGLTTTVPTPSGPMQCSTAHGPIVAMRPPGTRSGCLIRSQARHSSRSGLVWLMAGFTPAMVDGLGVPERARMSHEVSHAGGAMIGSRPSRLRPG